MVFDLYSRNTSTTGGNMTQEKKGAAETAPREKRDNTVSITSRLPKFNTDVDTFEYIRKKRIEFNNADVEEMGTILREMMAYMQGRADALDDQIRRAGYAD